MKQFLALIVLTLVLTLLAGCGNTELNAEVEQDPSEPTESTENINLSTLESRLGYSIAYDRNIFLYNSSGDADSFIPANLISTTARAVELTITKISTLSSEEVIDAVRTLSGYRGTMQPCVIGNADSALTFAQLEDEMMLTYFIATVGETSYFFELIRPVSEEIAYGAQLLEMLNSVMFTK
ncbi:MAG: hypothetical protein Q4C12_07535 [Clostridia bacterium]|nr:hypothetical protein [Clostridia bacterium]